MTEPAFLQRRALRTVRPLPAAYAALKPLFTPDAVLREQHILGSDVQLPIPAHLVAQLTSGDNRRTEGAIRQAQACARIARLGRSFNRLGSAGINGRRLVAALLIPIRRVDVGRLVAIAYPTPETLPSAALQEGSLS